MTNQKQLESSLPLLLSEHLALTRHCADTAMMNQTDRKLLWEEALAIEAGAAAQERIQALVEPIQRLLDIAVAYLQPEEPSVLWTVLVN